MAALPATHGYLRTGPSTKTMSAFAAETDRLPADTAEALAGLRRKADALAQQTLSRSERFAALEALRDQAIALTESQRSSYCGKPIPLSDAERQAWENAVGTWQAFYFGYALCADADLESQKAATVWQRTLDSLGRAIREHPFAYRAVPPALWKEFHSCFRTAAECSLADTAVADAHGTEGRASCSSTYLHTLLHDSANLYALSALQMHASACWLPRWIGMARLATTPPADGARSPLAVDLGADGGARLSPRTAPDASMRYLDTAAIGAHLRALADEARNARPAPELQAAALPQPMLERLLTHLYVQWCSAGAGRMDERHGNAVRAQAAVGMHAVHFQISGRAFRQPGLRYTREEEHDLATFGHITERTEQRLLTGRSAALEPWEIVNESASGLLGLRRKGDLASRIAHGQLVALRTSSIDPPTLGVVQRLRVEVDGSLHLALRLFKQEARGVAVRTAGDPSQKYERALLLETGPEGGDKCSLIVAAGRFRPGARAELYTNRAEPIRIEKTLEASCDFERVTFLHT
jgi:hypothetical protein